MIYEGSQLSVLKIGCPECGQTTSNQLPGESAFLRILCGNRECDMYSIPVTIEKRCSDVIFSVGHHYRIDGKPARERIAWSDYSFPAFLPALTFQAAKSPLCEQ